MNALHADGLGSVRAVTDAAGLAVERTTFRPYGEEVAGLKPFTLPEAKGFIGERYDDASGKQYLNARYYDPKLAMFIQPDWWEVMKPGVGTNRYSYSFGDPVNGRDPGGISLKPLGTFLVWDMTLGNSATPPTLAMTPFGMKRSPIWPSMVYPLWLRVFLRVLPKLRARPAKSLALP